MKKKSGDPFFLMFQYNNDVERNRQKKNWEIYGRTFVMRDYVFLKHFCFCAPCLTVGAVPLLQLSRNRESANVKVLNFVGSDQRCGTKFSACSAYW